MGSQRGTRSAVPKLQGQCDPSLQLPALEEEAWGTPSSSQNSQPTQNSPPAQSQPPPQPPLPSQLPRTLQLQLQPAFRLLASPGAQLTAPVCPGNGAGGTKALADQQALPFLFLEHFLNCTLQASTTETCPHGTDREDRMGTSPVYEPARRSRSVLPMSTNTASPQPSAARGPPVTTQLHLCGTDGGLYQSGGCPSTHLCAARWNF